MDEGVKKVLRLRRSAADNPAKDPEAPVVAVKKCRPAMY
jgi:hypothetical protein